MGDTIKGQDSVVTRLETAPKETYPGGEIAWLASAAANGSRELTVGQTRIDVGKSNPLHRHPNCEEALYVLSGEIEHYIENTPKERMGAGDCIVVPRNAIHQAVNIGATPVTLLVSFSSAHRETIFEKQTG